MAQEHDRRLRSPSPSGRDSPLSHLGRSRRPLEDESIKNEKPYRRWASQVERAVVHFDTARLEWPDYISGLGRLFKALQAHPPDARSIPHKSLVANKLAQCLDPSLPSGVHSKTLENYDLIFAILRLTGLARDLPVFLPGLSPVLSFASLSIRPVFLTLLEKHIVNLNGSALRPALRALLLCLLPGLEEENSEDFERTFSIVERIRVAVSGGSDDARQNEQTSGEGYFWQCLFLATITTASRRQGILAFLSRRLPKLGFSGFVLHNAQGNEHARRMSIEKDTDKLPATAEAVVSPEPGLLIRCFAAGLEDDQPLIQRGFLDLLLTHLPLDSPVLTQRVGPLDLERLVSAASTVVSRRDMSLNRRLWSWLLGPEDADDETEIGSPVVPLTVDRKNNVKAMYFLKFGLVPLSRSILRGIQQANVTLFDIVKAFRTALSLMDRWEIGHSLTAEIFEPAFSILQTFRIRSTENEFQEALRSASGFFDGIEAGLVWAQIMRLVSAAFEADTTNGSSAEAKLQLACFIIQSFNIHDEEMMAFHIPLCCVSSMSHIKKREKLHDGLNKNESVINAAITFVGLLIEQMPERLQLNTSFRQQGEESVPNENLDAETQIIDAIAKFYADSNGDLSSSPPPFSSSQIVQFLLTDSAEVLLGALREQSPVPTAAARAKLLSDILMKTPHCHELDLDSLTLEFRKMLTIERRHKDDSSLTTSVGKLVVNIFGKASPKQKCALRKSEITSVLVNKIWLFLSPSTPQYHVESVRILWQLDSADSSENILESFISHLVLTAQPSSDNDVIPARRFAILWTHSMNIATNTQNRGNPARRASVATVNAISAEAESHQSILTRPLLLVLEGLYDDESELYFFLVGWLKLSGNLSTVLDVVVMKLKLLAKHQNRRIHQGPTPIEKRPRSQHNDQIAEICYYLKLLLTVIRLPIDNLDAILSAQRTGPVAVEQQSNGTLYASIVYTCLELAHSGFKRPEDGRSHACSEMQCQAVTTLQQMFALSDRPNVDMVLLEQRLLDMLRGCTQSPKVVSSVQVTMLATFMSFLKHKYTPSQQRNLHQRRFSSIDGNPATENRMSNADAQEGTDLSGRRTAPPEQLLKLVQKGITSPHSRNVLESWVSFLIEILPLYSQSLFQNLIPFVESFCKQIDSNVQRLRKSFVIRGDAKSAMPETSLISLLNGLENVLAIAHDRLAYENNAIVSTKASESSQSLLGNVVSGVFAADLPKTRQSSANSRLTVILCIQDTVRMCFSIWSWAAFGKEDEDFDVHASASFSYSSSRIRNRARRLLDRLFFVEPLECLETLLAAADASRKHGAISEFNRIISLVQNLDGSRPKRLMPALFNSLYSRTNPAALEQGRLSTLTSDVRDIELGHFLVDYTKSLDDDAMDEIWTDCMTFLKDVLSNPFVHKAILPCLLLFVLTLAGKVEKTNFGEQRKMRRELSDIFQRLLQAVFTSRPIGLLQDAKNDGDEKQGLGILDILSTIVTQLHVILTETDKQLGAITMISSNVFGPVVHAKQFPDNVGQSHVSLLQKVVRMSAAAKIWRKDVTEIFNHPKLFSIGRTPIQHGILSPIRQWGLTEKDRIIDTLSRIPAPTAAGIMFGVGANTARLEADKKSQLNLRRAVLLILALDNDALVPHISAVLEKISEVLGSSVTSSPSSATRAEVFMLLQVMVLKTAPIHLSSLWPLVTAELQRALSSLARDTKDHDTYSALSLLQACKLLDLLLLIGPDDFQMHAWLFVTDTIDAVYRPVGADTDNVALADEMAEELNQSGPQTPGTATTTPIAQELGNPSFDGSAGAFDQHTLNTLLLKVKSADVKDLNRDVIVQKHLRPWLAQLSLQCFEREYSMRMVDWKACREGLLEDLFEDGTMVS